MRCIPFLRQKASLARKKVLPLPETLIEDYDKTFYILFCIVLTHKFLCTKCDG